MLSIQCDTMCVCEWCEERKCKGYGKQGAREEKEEAKGYEGSSCCQTAANFKLTVNLCLQRGNKVDMEHAVLGAVHSLCCVPFICLCCLSESTRKK